MKASHKLFPGIDPTPTIDCPALANTGIDALFPLVVGLAIVAFGIAFFALSRGRMRKSGVALGLVLLLAGGGAGLAITAPASSASADDCTPLDYAIEGLIDSTLVDTGDPVVIAFRLTNEVDRDGVTPITVTIPKSINITAPSLNASSVNWTLDASGAEYVFSYNGPLPKGTISGFAQFDFTATNNNGQAAVIQIPATIVTGSGGDSDTTNNTVVFDLTIIGIVP